jgi:hypothetical protein
MKSGGKQHKGEYAELLSPSENSDFAADAITPFILWFDVSSSAIRVGSLFRSSLFNRDIGSKRLPTPDPFFNRPPPVIKPPLPGRVPVAAARDHPRRGLGIASRRSTAPKRVSLRRPRPLGAVARRPHQSPNLCVCELSRSRLGGAIGRRIQQSLHRTACDRVVLPRY